MCIVFLCAFSDGELDAATPGQSYTAREQGLHAGGGAEADEGTAGAAEIYGKILILIR